MSVKNNFQNTKIKLISCLSDSWGGMEMVAYDMAELFFKEEIPFLFICLMNSPLHLKLKKNYYSHIALKNTNVFSRFSLIEKFDTDQIDFLILHKISDIRFFIPLLLKRKAIEVIGFSHSFISIHKNDFIHKLYYSYFSRLIALTSRHAENLLQHLPISAEKVQVIPNSVEISYFTKNKKSIEIRNNFGFSKKDYLIGLVSRLDPGKGQLVALNALLLIKEKIKNIKLVFVGQNTLNESDYEKKLKNFIIQHDLQGYIKFIGHLEDVSSLVANFDILIQPSRAETFGRSIIEAMASGVPVISTNAGGVPDILKHSVNGVLIKSENSVELANAIEGLSLNSKLKNKIVNNAYSDVLHKYQKNRVNEQLLKLFNLKLKKIESIPSQEKIENLQF